jgi:hypothetical protein
MRTSFGACLALVTVGLIMIPGLGAPAATEPANDPVEAKALFCGYGSVGLWGLSQGPRPQFAVAVVEINSPREIKNVAVSQFVLFDRDGKTTNFKRVVGIEEFHRPRVATEGEDAYYLNPGNTIPWNGTLPAEGIRLRIKVQLLEQPSLPSASGSSWEAMSSRAR